jgi:hypothetical protein
MEQPENTEEGENGKVEYPPIGLTSYVGFGPLNPCMLAAGLCQLAEVNR